MTVLPRNLTLPARTRIGGGVRRELLSECEVFGRHGLIVHGSAFEQSGLRAELPDRRGDGLSVALWKHPTGEPTLGQLQDLLAKARHVCADWVAGVGGGSVLDLAKACAGLLHATESPRAYHDGAPLPLSRTPFIAAPTTAGTGSEATTVSVLTNEQTGVKKSIRHASHMAQCVLLDHELLWNCPPPVIASSGMDALTQAVESFVSTGASWITDALALKALELIAGSLEDVYGGERGTATEALLLGSYLAGVALSNARLGLVHGLAHPLGARAHLPHGLVCAVCLPHVLRFNREAMGEKYARLSTATGADLLHEVERLLGRLGIASPFAGKPFADPGEIVQETLASGSTKANPRAATAEDVMRILTTLTAVA